MTSTEAVEAITFEPPGPGHWMLDVTHHGRRPITRFIQPTYAAVFASGMAEMAERNGLPVAEFRTAFVQGCMYVRVLGIGEPDQPKGGPPPTPAVWLLTRLHPSLRKCTATATRVFAEQRWRHDVDAWFDGGRRAAAIDANLAVQAVDPAALDDEALLGHLCAALDNFRTLARASFVTHGGDLVPVGDYLAHTAGWGIDTPEAASLLAGASPASLETAQLLAPVARAIAASPTTPADLAEVRSLGAEVESAIDTWMSHHGRRLLFSDDLDSTTLAESPALQLRALLAAAEPATPTCDATAVRARVPAPERSRFDEVLTEARYGLRLRDDNVGIGWNWPAGLLRRALLEIGERLVRRDALDAAEHVLELDDAEVAQLLRHESGPTPAQIADRWTRRQQVLEAAPPDSLGPATSPPPTTAFPAPLGRAARAVEAMIDGMQGARHAAPLHGTGVGDRVVRGRARVITDVATALAVVDEGDIVVTSFTGPAWNSLFPLLDAIVVEEGGALSHAAIVAREFATPAVIGVTGATTQITDGDQIEVDPTAGVVRIL